MLRVGFSRLVGWRADKRLELASQRRAVDADRVFFLDPLDGAALDKQAFDRIERRQRVMTRVQLPAPPRRCRTARRENLRDAAPDRSAGSILPAARRCPDRAAPPSACCAARYRSRQESDKRPVEVDQAVPVVKLVEGEPVLRASSAHQRCQDPGKHGEHVGWVERSETHHRSPKPASCVRLNRRPIRGQNPSRTMR